MYFTNNQTFSDTNANIRVPQIMMYQNVNQTGKVNGTLTEAYFLNTQTARKQTVVHDHKYPITVWHKVKQLNRVYSSAQAAGNNDYVLSTPKYIATSDDTTEHYGLEMRLQNLIGGPIPSSTNEVPVSIKLVHTFYISCQGIRLTHPDNVYDPAWDTEHIGKILEVLQPLGEIKQHTYGHEVSVKSKRHHFHFHLSMDWDPQRRYIKGLASWIRRRLAEDHEVLLPEGSNCCIKQFLKFKDNTSPERWFGYVFKDMKDLKDQSKKDPWAWPSKHNHGFHTEDIHDMWCRATTEREIAIK
eukprot:gene187-574_t